MVVVPNNGRFWEIPLDFLSLEKEILDWSQNTRYTLEFYLVDLETWHHSVSPEKQWASLEWFLFCFGYICDIGAFLALREILSLHWDGHIVSSCLAADTLYCCEPEWHHVKGIRRATSCFLCSISESALPFDYIIVNVDKNYGKPSWNQNSVQEDEYLCGMAYTPHQMAWNFGKAGG